jgi:hypothetical protein
MKKNATAERLTKAGSKYVRPYRRSDARVGGEVVVVVLAIEGAAVVIFSLQI